MNHVLLLILSILSICFLFVDVYESSSSQVNSLETTGYLPLGRNWPFEVDRRQVQGYEADYSDNEDDDTVQEKNVDKERRHLLWDVILDRVDEDHPKSAAAILDLSDPNIFMLLTFHVELLNDLIFLDYLTEDNNYAFTYMAHTLQQLAVDGEKQTTAPHMELPFYVNLLEYWKDLLSNSGDHMHPQDVLTFFRYHKDFNGKFGVPTRTLQFLDLCFPLHFIFFLLRDAIVEPCPESKPFGKNSKQRFLTS